MPQTRCNIGALALTGLTLLTSACASTALIRVGPPNPNLKPAAAPIIEAAIDLGGVPIRERGEVTTSHSDKRFTPGEWVALRGAHLSVNPRVTVGAREIPVAGYFEGGSILIRVPRGLPPGEHMIKVTTAAGSASTSLPVSIYVFGADTHGNALRFRRIGPGSGGNFEDAELNLEFKHPRFQALSHDGALLYAIQKPKQKVSGLVPSKIRALIKVAKKVRGGPVKCDLLVVHLGGKDRPSKVRSVPLALRSKPTGMAISPKGQLVILQARQLSVLDLSDPLQPQEVTTLAFADKQQQRELVDAVFLADGRWLAVLEAYENRVHLVDFKNPAQPRRLPGIVLSAEIGQPFSIDLAPSDDGKSLWVLQGPNLRVAGKRLLDGLKALWGNAKKLEFKQGLSQAGDAAVGAAQTPQEGLCRLVELTHQGAELRIGRSLPLPPDLFPYFIQPDGKGAIYVSGVNRKMTDLSGLALAPSGLKDLLQRLKGTAQLGRVLKVPIRGGAPQTALQGMAVYYDMAQLPNGKLVTSTVRLGPGYLPPRLTLDWGFELPSGRTFVKLREVANTGFGVTAALQRLVPPYTYERIGSQ